jgi:hypothetical protein
MRGVKQKLRQETILRQVTILLRETKSSLSASMLYSRMKLPRILVLLGCALALVGGCARLTTGVQMNAPETPLPAATAAAATPVTFVVVGPASTSLPLSQIKTATPYPTAHAGGTVNMQNAESGVSLHVGERFLLDLGERGWNIRLGEDTVVTRDSDPNVPAGSQGYFKAIKAGQTKLFATSDPPCRSASPPCMLPSLFLEIPITVLP